MEDAGDELCDELVISLLGDWLDNVRCSENTPCVFPENKAPEAIIRWGCVGVLDLLLLALACIYGCDAVSGVPELASSPVAVPESANATLLFRAVSC